MKNFAVILLVFLIVFPPVQVHNDSIVYDHAEKHFDVDDMHEMLHHDQDTEQEKERNHHHHCTIINFALDCVMNNSYFYYFFKITSTSIKIDFYSSLYQNSYLSEFFQPPKK